MELDTQQLRHHQLTFESPPFSLEVLSDEHQAIPSEHDESSLSSSIQDSEALFKLAHIVEQLQAFQKCNNMDTENCASRAKSIVALQLPDDYLWASYSLVRFLAQSFSKGTGSGQEPFEFIVLADTQYSACCVDEVAAQHVHADLIIHFGRSCLSMTDRIPVILAFDQLPLDMEALVSEIRKIQGPLLVLYDVSHAHMDWNLLQRLENVNVATVQRSVGANGICAYQRIVPKECTAAMTVLYVGPNSPAVTRFACTYSQQTFLHFDSNSNRCEPPFSLYKKRYAMMQKAKDAQTIGIVVGTLGVSNYLHLIKTLKKIIRHQDKKCYTFALGKLNVPKLANFSEIDIFVLVACPESTIIDSKEFFRPVITPYEMIVALESTNEWNGRYEFKFQGLLSRLKAIEASNDACAMNETTKETTSTSSDLIVREVGEIALKRSWRGLEVNPDGEKSMALVQGRHGIASQYHGELQH